MHNGCLTEPTVAKKQGRTPRPPEGPPVEPQPERVEMQVPFGWIAAVDAAARAVGLSRSAYIRLAVARLMQSDRKAQE